MSWEDAGFGVLMREAWLKGFTGRAGPDGGGTFDCSEHQDCIL